MKLTSLLTASAATLALFAANPAAADDHTEASAAALPSGPEGPALWKVSDEDTVIYLFGTIHALDPSVVWYDAEIDAALQSADTVVTEVPMGPGDDAAAQQLGMELGTFKDGTTLRSLLNEKQTAAYESAMASIGIPAEALPAMDQFEPWQMAFTLVYLPLLQQGYDLNAGIDRVILSKAPDTPRDALETYEQTFGALDRLSQDTQIEFMMEAVEGVGEVREALDAMVDVWIAGDAEGLAEMMNEGMTNAELVTALLYARNANWADWIDARMDEPGTVFIAVGAGHLAGDLSVQDYLAKRDIAVERIQ